MPALKKTGISGRITWLGLVRDRQSALASEAVEQVEARFSGPDGESHGGLTRPSCARMTQQYPLGTEIRNTRQFSILSVEEMTRIAQAMGLARLDPHLIGANMLIEGIEDFTHLPPASRLQGESGATLVVNLANRPCVLPGPTIEAAHPGIGARFKPAAKGLRGITAWVEREGSFRLGDKITLHIPDQRPWRGMEDLRQSDDGPARLRAGE